MASVQKTWSSVRLPLCNAFIVALLALIVIDAMPFSPPLLRDKISPLLFRIGLKQGEWNMFGPNPDGVNERISAEIEYADGTVAQWTSPAWRRESTLGRFPQSRRMEYLDNVTRLTPKPVTVDDFLDLREQIDGSHLITGQMAWDGLADYAARNHPGERPASTLRQVRLFQEVAEIPEPRAAGWPSMSEPAAYEEPRLRHVRDYP